MQRMLTEEVKKLKYPKLFQLVINHSGDVVDEIAQAGGIEKTRRVATWTIVKLQQRCYSCDQVKMPVHKQQAGADCEGYEQCS